MLLVEMGCDGEIIAAIPLGLSLCYEIEAENSTHVYASHFVGYVGEVGGGEEGVRLWAVECFKEQKR
jgi:hypothetical protein